MRTKIKQLARMLRDGHPGSRMRTWLEALKAEANKDGMAAARKSAREVLETCKPN